MCGVFLLTGELVFEAETPMKTLVRHLHDSPVPPSQRTEIDVPPALEALILQCLEKDPALRPADARAVLQRLRACQVRTAWDDEHARIWWETHLPDLCVASP